MRTHFRDIRLRNNAGMDMPLCYAQRKGPLDMDASRFPTTGKQDEVTCLHCRRLIPIVYPWTVRKPMDLFRVVK